MSTNEIIKDLTNLFQSTGMADFGATNFGELLKNFGLNGTTPVLTDLPEADVAPPAGKTRLPSGNGLGGLSGNIEEIEPRPSNRLPLPQNPTVADLPIDGDLFLGGTFKEKNTLFPPTGGNSSPLPGAGNLVPLAPPTPGTGNAVPAGPTGFDPTAPLDLPFMPVDPPSLPADPPILPTNAPKNVPRTPNAAPTALPNAPKPANTPAPAPTNAPAPTPTNAPAPAPNNAPFPLPKNGPLNNRRNTNSATPLSPSGKGKSGNGKETAVAVTEAPKSIWSTDSWQLWTLIGSLLILVIGVIVGTIVFLKWRARRSENTVDSGNENFPQANSDRILF